MKKKYIQWKKDYGFDELYDYERDLHESFDKRYNPNAAPAITDKHGVFAGVYRITIEYIEADEEERKQVLEVDELPQIDASGNCKLCGMPREMIQPGHWDEGKHVVDELPPITGEGGGA